jgi:hypothetical protein
MGFKFWYKHSSKVVAAHVLVAPRVEVQPHAYLTLALDGGKCSDSQAGQFTLADRSLDITE